MAMHEKITFDMREKLLEYESTQGSFVSPYWEKVKKLLDNRVDFMTYDKMNIVRITNAEYDCYAVNVFAGNGRSTLGLEVASALTVMFENFEYGSKDVIIHDYPSTLSMPVYVFYSQTDEVYKISLNTPFLRGHTVDNPSAAVFQDDNYVVILLGDSKEVHIHIFKR